MEETKIEDGKGGYKVVSSQQQSSMELSMNAKKEYSFSIKIYEDDPEKAEAKLKDFKARIESIIGTK